MAILIAVTLYAVWPHLPLTLTRYRDIQLGNTIIENIEKYRTVNGLPDRHDWETLKNFGFEIDGDVWEPQYEKINDNTYALIFVEGFDGPYLVWTSTDKTWKVDMPPVPEEYLK